MTSASDEPARLGRRQLLRYAGGAAVFVAGAGATARYVRPFAAGQVEADSHLSQITQDHYMFLGGTDGWIGLPPTPPTPIHPDTMAADKGIGLTTYIFGFRNITELDAPQRALQKEKAQHSAPLFWVNQFDPNDVSTEFVVDIENLGLAVRPDLFDEHSLHWHGFRNVIPFFDGEPTGSVAVPPGTVFRYVYRPREEGTYMYHCHVEDVEHVHMGMNGLVFVRPLQNSNMSLYPSGKYLYNDGDGSTGYDREFALHLSEIWNESHWADAHIQLPEWSDYKVDFALINGRTYPDSVAPAAPFPDGWGEGPTGTVVDSGGAPWTKPYMPVKTDVDGVLVASPGYEHLQYQPATALVRCMAGERVALRFSNLGFKEAAMTVDALDMRVVGRDATPMRGRDGTDTSYRTHTLNIGAGESFDVIVDAPPFSGGTGSSGLGYDMYLLYNRSFMRANNLAPGGFGGQATEIRVYPTSANIPVQTVPNT
ncbi:MAG: multicopper oxidase domain-containing protein [Actinomycetota bacterium]|nr:multicopper oxidase domain-containing protein [Actinomycetota bacterium]